MTEETSPNKARNDNTTFERLRELQLLLKKESALKELCKK